MDPQDLVDSTLEDGSDVQNDSPMDSQDSDTDDSLDSMDDTDSSESENSQQATPKMIEAERFNKLQSHYQKGLAENRKYQETIAALLSQKQYYEGLENELRQIKELQGQRAGQQPAEDLSNLTPEAYMARVAENAKQQVREEMRREREESQRAEAIRSQQETENQRNQKFQSRMDKIKAIDPDIDEESFMQFMRDNENYNPLSAYKDLYRDSIAKQSVAKIQKQTAEKIASNAKNNVASRGRSGVAPTAKNGLSTADDRIAAFTKMVENG